MLSIAGPTVCAALSQCVHACPLCVPPVSMPGPLCIASLLPAVYTTLSSYCVHTLTCYTPHLLCAGIHVHKQTPRGSRHTHLGALLVAGHSRTKQPSAEPHTLACLNQYSSIKASVCAPGQNWRGLCPLWLLRKHACALHGPTALQLRGKNRNNQYHLHISGPVVRGSALDETGSDSEGRILLWETGPGRLGRWL